MSNNREITDISIFAGSTVIIRFIVDENEKKVNGLNFTAYNSILKIKQKTSAIQLFHR